MSPDCWEMAVGDEGLDNGIGCAPLVYAQEASRDLQNGIVDESAVASDDGSEGVLRCAALLGVPALPP